MSQIYREISNNCQSAYWCRYFQDSIRGKSVISSIELTSCNLLNTSLWIRINWRVQQNELTSKWYVRLKYVLSNALFLRPLLFRWESRCLAAASMRWCVAYCVTTLSWLLSLLINIVDENPLWHLLKFHFTQYRKKKNEIKICFCVSFDSRSDASRI